MGTIKTTNIEPIADNGTVTLGSSGDTITIPSGVTMVNNGTQSGFGITMADSYRITADVFKTGTSDITANWEKVDTDSPGFIGSSMTESSGVFSFPSTGIYLILSYMYIVPDGVRIYSGHRIKVTTNNSTYNSAAANYQHTTAGNYTIGVSSNFILDVTDTSNVKVKLEYSSDGSATIAGSSTENLTVMTFIRLGDT